MNYIIFIVIYVFVSIALYRIAKRLATVHPWTAAVPIAREWLLIKMTGKSWKWFVCILIPVLNIVVAWLVWGDIARKLNRSVWLGRLMVLPLINIILIGALAFEVTSNDVKRWADNLCKWLSTKVPKKSIISDPTIEECEAKLY